MPYLAGGLATQDGCAGEGQWGHSSGGGITVSNASGARRATWMCGEGGGNHGECEACVQLEGGMPRLKAFQFRLF